MSVNQGAQQRLLKEAAEALKNGNRVRCRDLLLRIIQADRDMEAAWWLLYQALDDPAARARALENVLRLNPRHLEANQALLQQRQQRLSTARAEAASFLDEAAPDPEAGLDDQYQCPYCGQPTRLEDSRCPHCRGGLYVRVARSRGSQTFRLVELLLGISLAAGVIELIGPALALGALQTAGERADFGALTSLAAVTLVLGDFLRLGLPQAQLALKLLAARAVLFVLVLFGLRARWSLAFYGALLAAGADLLLSAYLLVNGELGVAGAVVNGALSLAVGVLLFGLSDEFAVTPERILVKADTTARSALDFYKLGLRYRRRGMWAMAVAQWRKAVGLAPNTPQYYKQLGIGYAQIKRFSRSLRTLEEGQRQAPHDRELAELIALVKARADTQALLQR
jgi:tetratricopeptide (TPR) repeat protein